MVVRHRVMSTLSRVAEAMFWDTLITWAGTSVWLLGVRLGAWLRRIVSPRNRP